VDTLLPAPGYRAERPSRGDLEAIGEVLVACDVDEVGEPDVLDAQALEEEWDAYPVNLATDAWLVRSNDGGVAAYAHAAEEIPSRVWEAIGWVHPGHRGRGLGGFLVRATEQDVSAKLRENDSLHLHHVVMGNNKAGRNLMNRAGFEVTRHFWHMEIDLGASRPRPPLSPGISIAPLLLERDEPDIHRVLEASFAQHWGFASTPYEKWLDETVRKPWFDATLSFVARSENEVVGALIGRVDHGRGFVDDLGVLKEQRGRGIGAALLDAAFSAFEQRGLARARLNVDAGNETGAVRLYERVGMRRVRSWIVFAKEITAPSLEGRLRSVR
jgi:mycothiol synthase